MVHNTFRVAGGAGGVVQGNGLPFVLGPVPFELGIALGEEGFVIEIAQGFAFAVLRIVHVDHQNRPFDQFQSLPNDRVELAVGNQYAGFAMLKHEGDGFGVQTYVQGVEHRADHGYTKVGFQHGRNIRQHGGNGIALANTPTVQGGSQAAAALIGFLPVTAQTAVDDGRVVRVDRSGAFNERQR